MLRRPKDAPSRIPAWAFALNKWLLTKPRNRGPEPGPKVLPPWFWPWRAWVLAGRPKPPAPPQAVTMYDSIDVTQIPSNAAAVAGYVNGRWPTFSSLVRRFPKAHRLSIAVTTAADAECLDVEPGDAVPAQAAAWVKRQHARGVVRPVVYCSVSAAAELMATLARAGIARDEYRLWTAHYNFRAHRCSSACGFGFRGTADATQYHDRALGRNLDASLCAPGFFTGSGV